MRLLNRHRFWQAVGDAVLIAAAWYLAFALRFDYDIPERYMELVGKTLPLVVGIKLAVFIGFGFYNHWWRYVSIGDVWSAARGVAVGSLVGFMAIYLIDPVEGVRCCLLARGRRAPPPGAPKGRQRTARGNAPGRSRAMDFRSPERAE